MIKCAVFWQVIGSVIIITTIKFMFDMNNELRLKLNETSQLKVF